MDLKKSLRMAMAMHNATNKSLGKSIGVSSSHISNWLSGRLGIGMLNIVAICDHFDMRVSEFIALGE